MATAVVNRYSRVPVPAMRLARAARRALATLGRPSGAVDVLLVGDAEMRRLNVAYRGVRRRTDVLAFPLEVPGAPGSLVGQIVISADAARRQARRLDVPLWLELELLVTHGVLHAVGYDDRDPVEAGLMHARERQILSAAHGRLPDRLWRGLLESAGDRRRRLASVSGHPRTPAASRARSRESVGDRRSHAASVSGHPRTPAASRAPLQ